MFPIKRALFPIVVVLIIAAAAQARPEPPSESHDHGNHGHGSSDAHSSMKLKPAGPSKIFGWLGSRFAKIPQYIPRFPSFPKYNMPQKLPAYQAIILPEPPKSGYGGKGKLPEKVKITPLKQTTHSHVSYESFSPSGYSSIPSSAYDFPSHSSHSSSSNPSSSYDSQSYSPQIEVLQSTLLYHNKEVLPASPISSPPLTNYQSEYSAPQSHHSSYSTIPYSKPESSSSHKSPPSFSNHHSSSSHYSAPSTQNYKSPAPPVSYTPVKQSSTSSGMIPMVPQSMGPDYFDTAYRSPAQYQEYRPSQFPSTYQTGGESFGDAGLLKELQTAVEVQLPMSTYYSPTSDSESAQYSQQQLKQPAQQNYAVKQSSQPSQQYSTVSQTHSVSSYQGNNVEPGSIHSFANQALGNQPLSSLLSSLQGDEYSGQRSGSSYISYQLPSTSAHGGVDDNSNAGSSRYHEAESPGVKILSQGTESGNPVFEVIADANAPDFNGHPFDINKLIAMIEPGAQLESADMSHAASETKSSYLAPVNASAAEDAAAAALASSSDQTSG